MKYIFIFASFFILMSQFSRSDDRNYKLYETKSGTEVNVSKVASEMLKTNVIFFGEFHDDSVNHYIQKIVLEELFKSGRKIAVSFEMFERDVQEVIDNYLSGKINEEEFLKNSRPWPDYKEFYKPLLELAKANKAPVIASNVPRKYAAVYSNDGLLGIEKLPAGERKFIAAKIDVVDDLYQKNFYDVMIANMGMDSGYVPTPNEENMLFLYYGAQCVKDETMGESIVNFLKNNKDYFVIHFNGDFHSNQNLGTPQKVLARMPELKLSNISPAYLKKSDNLKYSKDWDKQADFIMAMEEKQVPKMPQMMMGGHLAVNTISKHEIKIEINTKDGSLSGTDKFRFKSPVLKKASVSILNDMKVEQLLMDGKPVPFEIKKDTNYQNIIFGGKGMEIFDITMKYSGKIYHKPNERNLNQRHAYSMGMISEAKGEGVYLPDGSFYPATENGLADFDVEVTLPKEFKVITSGTISFKDEGEKSFYKIKTELPTDELTLIAGRFGIVDSMFDGKRFSVYTIDNGSTAKTYLTAIIDYYKEYTKILGPYPYSGFAVVENFFATGFGMPGYTLLSNKLMQMPWITLTPGSLAHEFVHNWWGNSVYIDRNLGNWCEALTTFCSNFYYNVIVKKNQDALEWRKKALLSMEALPDKKNYALSKFKYQNNGDDAVIGYSKGGFLFYEAYKMLGDERFFRGLRNFAEKYKGKRASWGKISDEFNEINKKDSLNLPIKKVFSQYMMDTKIPTLGLKEVTFEKDTLQFTLTQDMMNYINIPVRIVTEKDTVWKTCIIQGASKKFSFNIATKVKSVTVDPNYQVMRHLNKWEIPYSFGLTLADSPLVILPPKDNPDYAVSEKLAEMMKESDYSCEVKTADQVKDEWKQRTIIVVGTEKTNPFFSKIDFLYPENIKLEGESVVTNGKKDAITGNILLMNTVNPYDNVNTKKFMTLIYCKDIKDAEQFRRLFRYQSYSLVMLAASKMGRPLAQMEYFPKVDDKSKLEFQFK